MSIKNGTDKSRLSELIDLREGVKNLLQVASTDKSNPEPLKKSIARHRQLAEEHNRKADAEQQRLDALEENIDTYITRLEELNEEIKQLRFGREIERLVKLQAQINSTT